jgi:hypothetical protein
MTDFPTLTDALSRLKGTALSSVEFLRDYVQLHFDGSTLTAYTQPYLVRESKATSWGDSTYRDSLCALIGVQIEGTEVIEGRELTLVFDDGTALKVSLDNRDYRGPEALEFVSGSGPSWVV